ANAARLRSPLVLRCMEDHLMPTHEQLVEAEAVVNRYREQIGSRCRLLFVVPDYFEQRPKACMNGWGSVFLSVAPDGLAMPCHNARNLPGLALPNVAHTPLADIWRTSQAFNAYRGDGWMKPPCRDCDERHKDFGGCRCQAFQITGDAAQADPVCGKSPHHDQVVQLVKQAPAQRHIPIVFRSDTESRGLHPEVAA
ncbi:MAG: SPASM domain-containing protein, partial [Hydrogenophaga sp.]|uniref:SPASM domain-containing protein n=1 Tax=Hydrogenophaga sp. TaxID=1904254 RepID=UPI0040363CDE